MKIALMTNNYKPFIGGVPISIERLARGLKELGHEVTIFAPTYKEQEAEENTFRYHSLIKGVAGGVVIPSPVDLRIEKEFKKEHFDIIHVHHPMLIGKTAVYLSKKYKIPMVFTYHTRYEQYLHYFLPKHLVNDAKIMKGINKIVARYLHSFFENCQHIFVPTVGMEGYLLESCLYKGTISGLPTGLDNNSYQVVEENVRKIREQYDSENIPLFCTVSRMAKEKNIEFLLRSIALFKERYRKPFKVLIIGDGPGKEEYEKMSKTLNIEKNVVFTGTITNEKLVDYYGASDAFLFASKTETQGIVIIEAFAAGTPVIGVAASGVSDLVKDEVNGYLVEEDEEMFVEKMLSCAKDKVSHVRLREGAMKSAFCFKESEVAAKAINQYNEVVEKYHSDKSNENWEAAKWKINIVS